MITVLRRIFAGGAVFSLFLLTLAAAAQTAPTELDRQRERVDLGVSGVGVFSRNTSGVTYLPQIVSLHPSSTLGALVQIRYTKSPLLGAEFNYSYARYTENFTAANTAGTPNNATQFLFGAQTNVSEYTLGYVAHAGLHFGVHPFGGVGGGVIAFRPTAGGGQNLNSQIRGAAYYEVGAEAPLVRDRFGLRVQFRQVFFGAPDYNANYLANNQRTISTEPAVGFYIHF